ncbi:TPA: hypothetical protein ACTL7P_002283 [Pseudomonas aeruginosa]|uniref:hypothetical protein n=1 Tax=Pseudomonadota TaxID=1224 RepID=UPI0015F2E3BE|nr:MULTISPECIES: hypothetical protein [Pseudomonadota]EKX9248592.1 hypothetical protein [Pseudomonas aeruginosa]MDG3999959.1 hypothetical protein [Pseudomonas aeruginosa]UFM81552.1 hypothetical protein LO755_25560 [Pseudomonas aeruginosa]HCE0606004.1 hypothetical protein [Pseudomonas aeruginosa]HCG0415420.1 hypothetical protein [Pseudomonas aeruginosa]
MAKASGFAVSLSKDRMDTFLECVAEEHAFAEPVADFQHSRTTPLVCFVVNAGKLTHIGLGRRGVRAGTGLSRLNIDKVEELAEPLSVRKLLNRLPKRNAASVRKRFQSGGLLTDKGFTAVVETIRQIAPQASTLLDRFSQARTERIRRLSERARDNLAQQKEALLTALSIAGMSRDPVQEWAPSDETPVSFLDGLPSVRLREDPMVVNDLQNLPGFEVVKTYPYGAAVFESEDTSERLTVILANRLPLEEQTGTDLIYFNETYQSFVMVQYKAMEREDRRVGPAEAVYRLPNAQLKEEIDRMDTVLSALKACAPNTGIGGFRLTENPFFLKLCSRLVFNPDDVGLVPGMYLPLDYWKLLESDPGIQGPKGGLRITYDNAQRHFDNTAFTTVVSKAWVGTTPSQSQVLQDVIRATLETGKAVAIAVKPKKSTEPRDDDQEVEEEALNE